MRNLIGFRSRLHGERGITIVELMVVIMLTAVVVTAAVGFYISAATSTALAQNVDAGTRQATNGMSEMSRMIRAATANPIANPTPGGSTTVPAVVQAAANSVTLYAYVNLSGSGESPVQVNFSVNAKGQLIETTWPATTSVPGNNGHWDFSSTANPSRILCDSIPTGLQLFHYLPASGPPEMTPPGSDATGLATIRSIQITLAVQPTASSSSRVALTNTVGMPNLGFTTTDSGSS